MDRATTLNRLEDLLPLAAQWATELERRVLCEGVPLSKTEIADAKAIGVRNPERVRLLRVETIPVPGASDASGRRGIDQFSDFLASRFGIGLWNFCPCRPLAGSAADCARTRAHRAIPKTRRNRSVSADLHFPMRYRWLFERAIGIGSRRDGGQSLRLRTAARLISIPA